MEKLIDLIDKKWNINLNDFKHISPNKLCIGYSVKCFKIYNPDSFCYGIVQSIKKDPIFQSIQKITIYNPVENSQKTVIPRRYLFFYNKKINYFKTSHSKLRKMIEAIL